MVDCTITPDCKKGIHFRRSKVGVKTAPQTVRVNVLSFTECLVSNEGEPTWVLIIGDSGVYGGGGGGGEDDKVT